MVERLVLTAQDQATLIDFKIKSFADVCKCILRYVVKLGAQTVIMKGDGP